jgi:tRNA threonylcarbamoyladenosine biosynthesis protein TsaE
MSELYLQTPEATEALACTLAEHLPAAAVVYLHGDLGAGKSTLARAFLRALGVTGTIRSPTYTLVEPYSLANDALALHLDLYRIADPGELEYLGLDPADVRLWLVEWPERGAGGVLPPPDLEIHLRVAGEGRYCGFSTQTAAGQAWLAEAKIAHLQP